MLLTIMYKNLKRRGLIAHTTTIHKRPKRQGYKLQITTCYSLHLIVIN